jgi:hypothetical protein
MPSADYLELFGSDSKESDEPLQPLQAAVDNMGNNVLHCLAGLQAQNSIWEVPVRQTMALVVEKAPYLVGQTNREGNAPRMVAEAERNKWAMEVLEKCGIGTELWCIGSRCQHYFSAAKQN